MKFNEILQQVKADNEELKVKFVFKNCGSYLPAHTHISKLIERMEMVTNCDGSTEGDTYVVMQTWIADDTDHRLNIGKLNKILPNIGLPVNVFVEVPGRHSMEIWRVDSYSRGTFSLVAVETECANPELCKKKKSSCCKTSEKGGCC